MSDTTLNRFLAQGTNAERLAFTPDPPTPASGPDPGYFFYETDTGDTYIWNSGTSAWVLAIASAPGTVTSVSVVSANGFAGSVATDTTTPAITLSTSITGVLKGNGTAISAATAGTDYSGGTSALATGILKSTTATGALTIAAAGDFPTLNQNTTGSAASLSATLVPTQGGTGIATYATGDLLYASASNVLSKLAAGTNTYVLTMTGGVPVWAAAGGGGSGTVNSGAVSRLAFYATAGTAVSGADGTAKVIIGTATASAASGTFTVYGDSFGSLGARLASATAGLSAEVYLSRSRGSIASPSAVSSGDTLGRVMFGGYTGSSTWSEIVGGIKFLATENYSSSGTTGSSMVVMLTRTGTNTRDDAFTLTSTSTTQSITALAGLALVTGGSSSLSLTTDGAVICNAPGGGAYYFITQLAGTAKMYFGVVASTDAIIIGSVSGDTCLRAQSKSILISTDGGVSAHLKLTASNGAAVFSSGITTGSTTLHTTSVALANGAAAQLATITNSPTAGNPTKWVPINDNGTTRYIPAW